ncbi:MAG: N-acetyl-gamma-glutamyl-phosphate reductase [Candidatus Omnitrophica bacterium]|nr:N-acetyl-gamma-glutamyl-phosphate reductase [Candidatus Omnitrophota bacterium]
MIQVSVVGASGYTGVELIKILLKHPQVNIASLTTRSQEPVSLEKLVPSLPKHSGLRLETFSLRKVASNSDVIFLALPHTQAMDLAHDFYRAGKIVIDLSADFRIQRHKLYEVWYGHKHTRKELLEDAVYGLPEAYREQIKKAQLVANPGCYATSLLLALQPALEQKLIEIDSIVADSKSGVSGAGRKLSDATHFCNVDENFSAYKVNQHQHIPEVEANLEKFAGKPVPLTFVPHLLPLERGILSTLYVNKKKGVTAGRVRQAYLEAFQNEPFVRVRPEGEFPAIKDVAYTNFCDLGIWTSDRSNWVIIISVIDNLLKGASGQAVQNMNIRCGFDETEGLL